MTVSLLQFRTWSKAFPLATGRIPCVLLTVYRSLFRGEKHSVSSVNPGVENPLWQGWC